MFFRRPAACRDPTKGQHAVDDIKAKNPSAQVEAQQLDLADQQSIRAFAKQFNENNATLDILINNAGIMNAASGKTKDGIELQLGTNHVGHFLLTQLLLDKLRAAAPARVVNVSSAAHKMNPNAMDTIYSDLNMEKKYSGWDAYSRSKMSNILFSNALNRKLAGSGVTSYALHPGVIYTGLWDNTTGGAVFGVLGKPFMKNTKQGAATSVFCATYPGLDAQGGGKYYADCHEETPQSRALDQKLQDDLWDISIKLTGLENEPCLK